MTPPSVPLDAIRQPAALFDADGRIAAMNDPAVALAGRSLVGCPLAEMADLFAVRSPDGAPSADPGQLLSRALAGEEVIDCPFTITIPDGSTLEILASASPVGDGDVVTGALVLWHDVTERRRAEEAVRALFGTSPDVMLLLDADGTVQAINETTASAFGHPADELVGRSIWDVMPPEVVAFRRERFEEALRSGRSARFEEVRGELWYDTIVEPILSDTGEVTRVVIVSRDISERKRAEEALRGSEGKLGSILDRSLDVLYRRDARTGRNEYYSPAIVPLTGFSPDECLAMSADEILSRVHPDDRPGVMAAKMEASPGRDDATVDYRFLCRDGAYRWFSDRFRIERDADGTPVAWEGIIRDIHDRRRAEEALRESRQRYRDLIEANVDFVWETDAYGRYTYCSPQMERLWGLDPATMMGRTPFDLMAPVDRERGLAAFAAMARDPVAFSGLRMTSFDGRGRVIVIEISGVPFFSADGVLRGFRGVTRDITERVESEKALRESEARLRLAQESAGIAIWDRDAATDRVFVAPGFIWRYLLDPGAMSTYADWERFIHPDDREKVESGRLAAIAAGEPLDLEFRIVIPSGEIRWLQLRGRGVADEHGNLVRVVGVVIDVTERRRAEEALRESEADARSFFANMVDPCAVCELVVDSRGEPLDIRLAEVNPAFEEALNLPARLIVGQTAFMILPALHRSWLDLFLEVGRQHATIQVEEPFPALGRRFHVTGFPVRGGRVAVVFRDITGEAKA